MNKCSGYKNAIDERIARYTSIFHSTLSRYHILLGRKSTPSRHTTRSEENQTPELPPPAPLVPGQIQYEYEPVRFIPNSEVIMYY